MTSHKNYLCRVFGARNKNRMNDDLVALVTEFAWGVKLSRYQVGLMVDCCLDCQTNIPDWFLDDVLLFMPTPSHTPPFWTAKMFNPLVPGAPFSPYDLRDARLNPRTCKWLFASIKSRVVWRCFSNDFWE